MHPMGPGHAWHQPLLACIDDADYGDREDPLAVGPRPARFGPARATWPEGCPRELHDLLAERAGYLHDWDGGVPGSPGGCYVAGAQHRYDVQDPARVPRGLLPGSPDPLGAIRFRTVAAAPSTPSWVTIRAPPGPRHASASNQMGKEEQHGGLWTRWGARRRAIR